MSQATFTTALTISELEASYPRSKPALPPPQAREPRVKRTNNCAWLPGLVKGLEVLPLQGFGSEHVALLR